MADQVKKIQITGGAAESYMSGTKTRKKSRSTVPKQVPSQKGGDNSGALVQLTASHVPKALVVEPKALVAEPKAVVAPVLPVTKTEPVGVASTVAKTNPSPILAGGAKSTDKVVKVVLAPKKKTQKVILTPAKKVVKLPPASTTEGTAAPIKKSRAKTHKVARRIRVSVEGLNKKINRAKTIKKESQTLTLEKIKSELAAAGLIKKESKAPESILRQMYTDFQLLKQRAL